MPDTQTLEGRRVMIVEDVTTTGGSNRLARGPRAAYISQA